MSQSYLNLLTVEDIGAPDVGRSIGELLLQLAPSIFPEKIGNCEPIEMRCNSPEDFATHWKWPVLARTARPEVNFSVWFRKPRRKYTGLYLDFESRTIDATVGDSLLAGLAALTKARFGMIQELSPAYRERAGARGLLRYTDKLKKHAFLNLFDESMRQGIPDAFDVMWLPSRSWRVEPQTFDSPSPGIFRLRGSDIKLRDAALTQITEVANQSTDPAPASGTSRAVHEPRHR